MDFKTFINNQYLYHATYKNLLPSIKKHGINSSIGKKNWSDSVKGTIYLSTDKDVAISYAESSDNVPDEWLDNIIVLHIKRSELDQSKLSIDKNILGNDQTTLEYKGIIPYCIITKVEYI